MPRFCSVRQLLSPSLLCCFPIVLGLLADAPRSAEKKDDPRWIKLAVKGVPPGQHAFHVHAVGKCEPPFTSAGGHFNPAGKKHGMEAAEGSHAGDMPNLFIPASGELTVEIANPMISLVKGQPNTVFDADGSAVIIHAGADDYKTDPTGNAGDRIACGVIVE